MGRCMLFERLHLKNVLSFGPDSPALDLQPLNVLIGPNGSGKSNLLDAISLLNAAPEGISRPLYRDGRHQRLDLGAPSNSRRVGR